MIVRGIKHHPGQARLYSTIVNHPEIEYLISVQPRGWGKSLFWVDWCFERMFNEPGISIGFFMPFYKQCSQIWKHYIEPQLMHGGLFKSANKSELSIQTFNGSTLRLDSTEKFESLRSGHLTYMILDEFDFMRKDAYNRALAPMMKRRGKLTVFNSTPNGKGQFYQLYQMGDADSETYTPGYFSFRSDIEETGDSNYIRKIYSQRDLIPEPLFRQEYLAEFLDEGGQVFTNINRVFVLDDFAELDKAHFGGVDIGKHNDRTVITILDSKGRCVFWKRFTTSEQSDGVLLANQLTDIIKGFPNIRCLWETNFDPSVFDIVSRNVKGLVKFNTNNESKNQIISRLNLSINKELISLPRFALDLREELLNYKMNQTAVRKQPSFSAPAGRHDDCVISLALANWIYTNYMKLLKS